MRIILHFIRQLCLPSDKIILGTFACIMIDNRPVGAVLIVVQYWIYFVINDAAKWTMFLSCIFKNAVR